MKFSLMMMFLIVMAAVAGCEENPAAPAAPAVQQNAAVSPAARAKDQSPSPRIVFLGDSLTAGYGIERKEAYPALIERMLEEQGIDVQIINMGVSGDTTAGGLSRLEWSLKQKPDVLVVGLGGNDGLRGIDLAASEQNLRQIIQRARERGVRVLLLGMMIPPNYGPEYTSQFREIYPRLARELDVPLVPFLLEGVGGEERLNQADGIHPTAEGHRRIAETVLPHLRELLQDVRRN